MRFQSRSKVFHGSPRRSLFLPGGGGNPWESDIDENVVALWIPSVDADEYNAGDTGKTHILDRTANGNDCLIGAGITDVDAFLNTNYPRCKFDGGANDCLEIAAGSYNDFAFGTGLFSVDIWFRKDALARNDGLCGMHNGTDYFYARIDSANNCVFGIDDGDSSPTTHNGNTNAVAAADQLLTIVRDSTFLRMYLDGNAIGVSAVGAATYNLTTFTVKFNIGCIGNNNSSHMFLGSINTVRISDKARSEAEHDDYYANSYFATIK